MEEVRVRAADVYKTMQDIPDEDVTVREILILMELPEEKYDSLSTSVNVLSHLEGSGVARIAKATYKFDNSLVSEGFDISRAMLEYSRSQVRRERTDRPKKEAVTPSSAKMIGRQVKIIALAKDNLYLGSDIQGNFYKIQAVDIL